MGEGGASEASSSLAWSRVGSGGRVRLRLARARLSPGDEEDPYDAPVMTFRPNVDELLANNAEHASSFGEADLEVAPKRRLAVVACMDSRMDIFAILGLGHGEAHIIRNAGGVVTDDVVRSLCLSQRLLGTKEVILIHHTDCGLEKVDETDFMAELGRELGVTPGWALESFDDPYQDVRRSMRKLRVTPFVPHREHVRGFVYDVATGALAEVVDETV